MLQKMFVQKVGAYHQGTILNYCYQRFAITFFIIKMMMVLLTLKIMMLKSLNLKLLHFGVGMVRMIMDFQQFQITDNQEVQLFGLQVCIKLMPEG